MSIDMTNFSLFKEIPNLQELCTNVCEYNSKINAMECSLCKDLKMYLSLAKYGTIVSHNTRVNTMEKLYGNKFTPAIKSHDINTYNKMYLAEI